MPAIKPHDEPKTLAPAPKDPFADNPNYDAQKDPGPNVTLVQQEQLKRSEEMEKVGVDKWVSEHASAAPPVRHAR